MYFNSIKVRLEQSIGILNTVASLGFQFHKGAIRTLEEVTKYMQLRHFNSIKVRLEPRLAITSIGDW